MKSINVVIGYCSANRAIYIHSVQAWNHSRHIAFCSALALYFGLHVRGQKAPIDEFSGLLSNDVGLYASISVAG